MSETEFNEIINTENPVLVSITSRYCDPCFLQKMVIEKVKKTLAKEYLLFQLTLMNFQI